MHSSSEAPAEHCSLLLIPVIQPQTAEKPCKEEHSHKIRITAAPFHFYIQDVHTVVENLAVAAPHRALTAPLKSNRLQWRSEPVCKEPPSPGLSNITDICNKRFHLCNLGEELSVCPPSKAALEQSKPFHLGYCVWTHRGKQELEPCYHHISFLTHTHAKRGDDLEHPLFRETFHFGYPGSKQTSHGTSRWFLLAFDTWKTLSTFLLIQVLSKQALASLRINSIILCAVTMENKKP